MAKKNKTPKKADTRNLAAVHAQTSGAGAHVPKKGDKAPRVRQKRDWKKNMFEGSMILDINEAVQTLDPFEQAIKEVEKEFNINLAEGRCGGSENEEGTGFTSQQKADMNKLIQQYQGHAGDVRSSLGDDLEMLEYQPEEIPPMIEYITSQLVSNN